MAPISPKPRSTRRGRPPVTTGHYECSRCQRKANKLRVEWPGDQLCHSCFYTAMRTHGICPNCGHDGVLPGRLNRTDPRSVCLTCAGIPNDYTCRTCGHEGEIYRRGECARCALRDDLCTILLHHPADPAAMETLLEVLCGVERPESILTWKRNIQVLELLGGITSGAIPLTHYGLAAGPGRHIEHLRSMLTHHDLLPSRDEHLAAFELWLAAKLDAIDSPAVRGSVEQFATWHHLRRLRSESKPGQSTDGPKRAAKQEITETIKFLTWLEQTHDRTASTCSQHDVDDYLAWGPTTRHLVRTFFVWAKRSKINTTVTIEHRQAKTTPTITQDQRLAWLKELLTGDSESLPYRIAGILLLLYAQPLTKIASLQATAVTRVGGETRIALGKEPTPVPEPFASQLHHHIYNRPNQRTTGGAVATPWLFPSNRPGRHLDPQSIMHRLRWLGISLLGSRNAALRELVSQIPAPLVAEMLGYSDQVTQKHAAEAGNTWAQYASVTDRRHSPTTPSGRTMTTDSPEDRPTGDAGKQDSDTSEPTLFDVDPPVRPYDLHLESLGTAAAAVDEARDAVHAAAAALDEARKAAQLAKEQLTQVVVEGRHAGLSWAKIAEVLGISQQSVYQRWARHSRDLDDSATSENTSEAPSEIPSNS
jgi:DNA-directed RNA polymerase specialized sigma24 family protein